ncbi:transcriptional regulator [Rhizobium sp. N122]|nr:transcriptional regulator [Rhizobium sp. N122]
MTVSRVLNGRGGASAETSQRILATANELNYRPNPFARGLRSDRSKTIGLLVPDITNPFFPEVIRGAEDAASAAGYNLLLSNVVENSKREEELIEALLRHRVDGIIVCSARLPDAALHKALAPHRAVVLINREAPNEIAGTIVTDYETGASRAIDHLVERGRRKIAIIAGPRSSFGGKSRLVGFRKTLTAHGLKAHGIVYCDPTAAGGQAAAQLLAETSDIDALICYNDLNAIGAMKACRAAGISIPGQIALIGFDDIPAAELLSPALTTLRVQKREMGEEAVRLLLSRIATKNRQHGIVIVPELIVRETT